MDGMTEAFNVLEDALRRCQREDMQTDAVHAALKLLSRRSREQWPFHHFWRAMKATAEELTVGQTGRWQTANAALNAIRLRVRSEKGKR